MSITIPKEYEALFGKQDFVVIPKSLYTYLPKLVTSKNPQKIDVLANRAAKAFKLKKVKAFSAIA